MHDVANPHREQHFEATETVRDVVIGLSDGLTVPFALAAGLSGALANGHLVVLAGLAEIAAGSIAMGLGGYLAARGDAEHYAAELRRERDEVVTRPEDEAEEIYEIFERYGVSREAATPVLQELQAKPAAYVEFMMRFELGLEEPAAQRAYRSAGTIAASYVAGGMVPLLPYMLVADNGFGAAGFGGGDAGGSGGVRGAERAAGGDGDDQECGADDGDRRCGGGGGVWVGLGAEWAVKRGKRDKGREGGPVWRGKRGVGEWAAKDAPLCCAEDIQ